MTPPIAQSAFVAAWTQASADEDLRRWIDFLAAHGLSWSPSEKDREFVGHLVREAPTHASQGIELRMAALTHEVLRKAGDPRRLVKHASGAWYLLSPEELAALRAQGHRFEKHVSPLASLATIPVTLGVYFAASAACEAAGLQHEVSWLVALAAYVVTHRLVRGRWPFQRAA